MSKEDKSLKGIDVKIDAEIMQCKERVLAEKKTRKYLDGSEYILEKLSEELKSYGEGLTPELPPANVTGDFDLAVPVFHLAKSEKKAPAIMAKELSDKINAKGKKTFIQSASPISGYVNIKLDRQRFYQDVLDLVLKLKDIYGTNGLYKGKLAIFDYSSPNIAKPFGVGHLRSTVIGESLARIYSALGFTVIRDNHLGDWGTQFGALFYAYINWRDKDESSPCTIEELKDLYVKFTTEATKDPTFKEKARELFVKLEGGDKELVSLWNKFKEESMAEFKKIYDELNIKFDLYLGESNYVKGGEDVLEDLEKKHIAKRNDEGAIVVEGLDSLPSFLLKKTDGSTLYILRDILGVMHLKKTFDPDKIVYVVGSEQELNFKQLFALCKAAGYGDGVDLQHVGFGLVMVDGKKMSTRKGTVVDLKDVIDEIVEKSKNILVEKKSVKEEDIDALSKKIGLGALVYSDLKQNRMSPVSFDWDKMLSLESGSIVYIQYTFARIMSILSKAKEDVHSSPDAKKSFEDKSEFGLALKMSFYPQVLVEAYKGDLPHLICNFLEDICSDFNKFYYEVPIIATKDADLRKSRLYLLESLGVVIKNALSMLNIEAIEHI